MTLLISAECSGAALDATLRPALEVTPPCDVVFETDGSVFARLARGESLAQIGFHNANLVTGPLYVRGAEPGDALDLEVLDVQLASAWSLWIPGLGPLGKHTDRLQIRQIALEGERAFISDRVAVPVQPMVGVLGLAPAHGVGSTVHPAYPWGGNMDLREASPGGGVLSLPVQVPGGMLFVGDLHAAMGVAEPTHVALEAVGRATIRVTLVKRAGGPYARLRRGNATLFIGVAETFDAAKQAAMDQVYAHLTDHVGLAPFDAYAYASARVGLRLGGPASCIVMAEVPDLDG